MAITHGFGAGMMRAWYLVARSRDLGMSPLPIRVLGRRLVLFRSAGGRAAALEDRCPHKNAELSLGRVDRGVLRCPYHGWGFDRTGACVHVPSAAPGDAPPRRGARGFAVHEAQGSIWVHLAEPTDLGHASEQSLPSAPGWPAAEGVQFEIITNIRAPLVRVLENFVDCSHTGFVHAGLFRSSPERIVRAEVTERKGGVHIETFGEGDPNSLLSRLLIRGGQGIEHVDEFIAPHTVRVVYRFGARRIVTVSICTPEEASSTRVFTRVWVDMPPFSRAVAPLLRVITLRILRQDKRVLEGQAGVLERFGGARFQSVQADRPTDWVARCLARFERAASDIAATGDSSNASSAEHPCEEAKRCEVLYRL